LTSIRSGTRSKMRPRQVAWRGSPPRLSSSQAPRSPFLFSTLPLLSASSRGWPRSAGRGAPPGSICVGGVAAGGGARSRGSDRELVVELRCTPTALSLLAGGNCPYGCAKGCTVPLERSIVCTSDLFSLLTAEKLYADADQHLCRRQSQRVFRW
jgi:hypothetical protein